jgi:hypothetical protein
MKLPWAKKKQPENRRNPHLMEGQDGYIFRRSRTITGTKSAEINASASAHGQFKTDRITLMELRERRLQIVRFLGGCVLAVLLLGFLIANFIVTPHIAYAQKGQHQPNAADYQASIYHYFDDHPFERFGFLLRPDDLQSQLIHDHTEVLAASIQRDWYGGNVQFNVTFRQPLLAWKTGVKQFYVDAQGVAFTYNHFAEPSLVVTDQSGIPPDQSGVVASTRFIKFLGQIVSAVDGYGKGAVEQVIIPPATREIDLKLQGRVYLIKTNTDRDPLQEAEDIANALKYFDQKNEKPQYIDARVAHKAFYK